jgi:ubiquinone/menaquinone biosynthesis C-methylase UbiE
MDSILAGRAVLPGGAVVGLDLSDTMVARARALAEGLMSGNVRFEQGPAENISFDDGTFDVAYANGLLNLCPDKAAVVRNCSES